MRWGDPNNPNSGYPAGIKNALWPQSGTPASYCPFGVGERQPVTRVLVDVDWWLNQSPSQGDAISSTNPLDYHTWDGGTILGTMAKEKLPVRWYMNKDFSQMLAGCYEIPNIKSCTIDRSIQNQAGTMELVVYNTFTPDNGFAHDQPDAFGRPGFFSWARGISPDTSRWDQYGQAWAWQDVLRENALLFVFQGYGAQDSALVPAITSGNLALTGVFLVDNVQIESGGGSAGGSGGLLTLNCRDMAKLLIDQPTWPPVVPQASYTSAGLTYIYGEGSNVTSGSSSQTYAIPGLSYYASSASGLTDQAVVVGGVSYTPSSAQNLDDTIYYVSEGYSSQTPAAAPRIQFETTNNVGVTAFKIAAPPGFDGQQVEVSVWGPQSNIYVSQYGWFSEGVGTVTCANPLIGETEPIPVVNISGVSDNDSTWYVWSFGGSLTTTYIRFTFTTLASTPMSDGLYHAAAWGVKVGQALETSQGVTGAQHDDSGGNYTDYSEIVSDLLLWSGWFFHRDPSTMTGTVPPVFGVIENTGIYNRIGPMNGSVWDKNPLMDNIQSIAQIVGFIARVGERGEFFFHPPNIWSPGNFDQYNQPVIGWDVINNVENNDSFFPVFDEKEAYGVGSLVFTDYIQTASDQGLVSDIIVAPEDPYLYAGHPNNFSSDVGVVRFKPSQTVLNSLHGIEKPCMMGIPLNVPVDLQDEFGIAELIAIQSYLTNVQGQITAVFDPNVTPDTQVKIYDRVTSSASIHYVTGVHTEHDLDQGTHLATYTTYWLGDDDHWVVSSNADSFLDGAQATSTVYNANGILVSEKLITYYGQLGSVRTSVILGTQKQTWQDVAAGTPVADLDRNAYGDARFQNVEPGTAPDNDLGLTNADASPPIYPTATAYKYNARNADNQLGPFDGVTSG